LRNELRLLKHGLIVAVLCISSAAFAGAWTKPRNHFYLQLGTSFSWAGERFNHVGDKGTIVVKKFADPARFDQNNSNFQQILSDLYFEFGLFNRITLFGDLTLNAMRQRNTGGDINYATVGLGDTLLGLRAGLLLDPVAIALEARMTAPSGDVNAVIPKGTGDFRGELRLALAKAFDRVPIWINFEFGFTLRGTAELNPPMPGAPRPLVKYAPEVAIHGEVGGSLVRWKGADRLLLIAALDYRTSTTRDTGDFATSLLVENYELTTFTANLVWFAYHGFGVNARFTQAVQGRRQLETSTIAGSLFVNY
jgi:hypothetical protein